LQSTGYRLGTNWVPTEENRIPTEDNQIPAINHVAITLPNAIRQTVDIVV